MPYFFREIKRFLKKTKSLRGLLTDKIRHLSQSIVLSQKAISIYVFYFCSFYQKVGKETSYCFGGEADWVDRKKRFLYCKNV